MILKLTPTRFAFVVLFLFLQLQVWSQTAVPACFGEKRDMPLGSQMPYYLAKVGTAQGYFLLDYGSTGSAIDTSAFMSGKPVLVRGTKNQFDNFDFYGNWGRVTLSMQSFSYIKGLGTIKQAGIIGNDFLAMNIFMLDYANKAVYRATTATFCSDADLQTAGFKAVSSVGYFSNDLTLLNNTCTPNIPTVPVRIGKATAVAQIDPGFDDVLYKHSVNINQAFYNSLIAAGVVLTPMPTANFTLSTCVAGLSEKVIAYQLPAGTNFEVVGTDGNSVTLTPYAYIFVKQTPAGAKNCGGIGTWQIPAAQFGASFLIDAKQVIFDPIHEKVWFNTK